MSKNVILEIPETESHRFEALLDALNASLHRIAQEAPRREAEYERLKAEGQAAMSDMWATIEHVEKTL